MTLFKISQTVDQYTNRLTPCKVTPTFRNVQTFIKGRTLDIGAGTGDYLEKFSKDSIGIDASKKSIKILKEKGLLAISSDINS